MGLIVQKFGGTSVADAGKIKAAAQRVAQSFREGNQVVVVVSARGQTTDELFDLANEITDKPSTRELDMLVSTGEQISIALMAMAIHATGLDAISFTGAQVGIVTDSHHTKARILKINTEKIKKELDQGKVVVVAGYQGMDTYDNITTLGRGGSDTTAVALAALLKADLCDIFTDVNGIYTADPRIVPEARKLDRISYDELLELASLGTQVMQARSIEFAKKYNVPLRVRPCFNNSEGTIICQEVSEMEEIVVSGATVTKDEAKIMIRGIPDRPGLAARIFRETAQNNVNVDMIIQNIGTHGLANITFTVPKGELGTALEAIHNIQKEICAQEVSADSKIAKLSVVGIGMRSHCGIAEKMFRALAEEKINIQMISTSEIKISCIIDESEAERALKAVHRAFELGKIAKAVR
ncbi:MAG: aspartate kinase [Planctomycetes bacterium RIFCSPHIGHO2_02_FULL_50_42]|nr:MAG: aspartate kinase [Planctomycetes bacterium GWA2_50_13]OHB90592.1 MAG: aspartate kinase [Planctomycetes bacterium RIFCSPHIGHO2_02_FULL_50_42]OHB94709.1 MAG: aspartate kinase [Planctomycetes bacterium RIFCSPLOWO2_02_FULL_50_16]